MNIFSINYATTECNLCNLRNLWIQTLDLTGKWHYYILLFKYEIKLKHTYLGY